MQPLTPIGPTLPTTVDALVWATDQILDNTQHAPQARRALNTAIANATSKERK